MDVGVHISSIDMALECVSVLGVRMPKEGNELPEMLSRVFGEHMWLREIS